MLSVDAKGVFPIAPTPFLADGAIDAASVDRMIDHYVAAGADGCTILGIMGEAPKLEHDEAVGFVARCVARAPKLPFIVGVSAPGFAAMRALSHAAMAKGAAGVMIAPPPSLRTDDQIVTYYAQAVEAIGSDIPFVIQDYPLTLGVIMTPNVIRRIITDNPSCVMLKHEDWPGLEKISALRRFEKEGKLRRVPDSHRQRRPVPRFRDGARSRRRDDRLRLPGNADRRRAAVARRAARGSARPFRRPSAPRPL